MHPGTPEAIEHWRKIREGLASRHIPSPYDSEVERLTKKARFHQDSLESTRKEYFEYTMNPTIVRQGNRVYEIWHSYRHEGLMSQKAVYWICVKGPNVPKLRSPFSGYVGVDTYSEALRAIMKDHPTYWEEARTEHASRE